MSFVSILMKNDRVIKGFFCIAIALKSKLRNVSKNELGFHVSYLFSPYYGSLSPMTLR